MRYGIMGADKPHWSNPASVETPHGAAGFPVRDPGLDLRPGFLNPPAGYGEVAFYWWNGDPLTKERMTWQLDQLKGKHISGLQVNYCHSDKGGPWWGYSYKSDPEQFTEKWWDFYGWYLKAAGERGMAVSLSDYTLGIGQGYYYDEILAGSPGMRGAILRSVSNDFHGPGLFAVTLPDKALNVTAYRMEGDTLDASTAVDLMKHTDGRNISWQAPEGCWRALSIYPTTAELSYDPMHPQSGAKVIEKFFRRFEDRFPGEGGRALNFFFSDELNFGVRGRLWNDTFAREFRKRKGYDIVPELPSLFVDTGSRTPKVRLDYYDVVVSLSEERFFKPLFDWHQQRGMIYGCDHGGRGKDVVEFGDYFRTQRWTQGPGCDQPRLGADIIKNKVASSISHLYQRPRVWLEGYYGSGWGTSTEQLVTTTLRNFAMGQNLLTMHGLYYTTHGGWWEWAPPCNHFRMPYWPHMERFFACTERLSYVLSQGVHCCDVAIMYPVAPVQAGTNGREAVSAAFTAGETLYRNGIDFDFIDFQSLVRATVRDGRLRVSGEKYRVLILPAMSTIEFAAVEKALAFAESGGIVIALGSLPQASDRVGAGDERLSAMVQSLFGTAASPPHTGRVGTGTGYYATGPEDALRFIKGSFIQDFEGKGCVLHRKAGPRDFYLVADGQEGDDYFFRCKGTVELWDPWTGGIRPFHRFRQDDSGTHLRLPRECVSGSLLVFSPGQPNRNEPAVTRSAAASIVELDGLWDFELIPTMNNRWGDFRIPASGTVIGPEARRLYFTADISKVPDWRTASTDDAAWEHMTCGFGARMLEIRLPDGTSREEFERALALLRAIDPVGKLDVAGTEVVVKPYRFSWRYGIENDPGRQGYHGLKELVSDEFIKVGEPCYLWTTVYAPARTRARIVIEGARPAGIWLGGRQLTDYSQIVTLEKGSSPLLLRYDGKSRGAVVLVDADAPAGTQPQDLAMKWYGNPGVLPYDITAGARAESGYRFDAPPGFASMTFRAFGRVQAWVAGEQMNVTEGRMFDDGSCLYTAIAPTPNDRISSVAISVITMPGYCGGSAIPDYIALDCGPGRTALGDWSKMGILSSYSGGAWYRRTVRLSADYLRGCTMLDLGKARSSAEVYVNSARAGVLLGPDWRLDISKFVVEGDNRIEVLVYSTLANHYETIPTEYRGSPVAGLLGPVRIVHESEVVETEGY
jgi:hypothetical protein